MTHSFYHFVRQIRMIGLVCFLGAIGFGGFLTYLNNGFENRQFAKSNTKKELGEDGQWAGSFSGCDSYLTEQELEYFRCARDAREMPTLAIIGDSKAAALAAGLFRTSVDGARWLMLTSKGGGNFTFLPILSHDALYSRYQSVIPYTSLKILGDRPQINTVVVAVAARHLFGLPVNSTLEELKDSRDEVVVENALSSYVDELVKMNKKVILLVDNPTLPNLEDCIKRKSSFAILNALLNSHHDQRCSLSWQDYLARTDKYRKILFKIAKFNPDNVSIFDQAAFLCNQHSSCLIMSDGRPLYGYTDHISDYAAGLIGLNINSMLQHQRGR